MGHDSNMKKYSQILLGMYFKFLEALALVADMLPIFCSSIFVSSYAQTQ